MTTNVSKHTYAVNASENCPSPHAPRHGAPSRPADAPRRPAPNAANTANGARPATAARACSRSSAAIAEASTRARSLASGDADPRAERHELAGAARRSARVTGPPPMTQQDEVQLQLLTRPRQREHRVDRKSTRLNSS